MDIKQLRYFVTITEEGQITRAAKRLHMAQPPLSRQLILLEQELGVTLLERNGHNLELTEAGKLLYNRAQSILNQLDQTITDIKGTGEGLHGVLSIGTYVSCIPHLTGRIHYFRQQYPLVHFKLWEGGPFYLREHLEKRNIEIAILKLPLKMNNISMIRLPGEPFVLVMPGDWDIPISTKTAIRMKDIAEIPLLMLHVYGDRERSYHETVIHECRRYDFEPNIVCECPNVSVILSLIIAGIGASILPKNFVSSHLSTKVKVVDILDFPTQAETAVIWLKDRRLSESALRFIETFQTE
ncbi:LysR family transcriptional regulator [Bacillus sp. JJ634]